MTFLGVHSRRMDQDYFNLKSYLGSTLAKPANDFQVRLKREETGKFHKALSIPFQDWTTISFICVSFVGASWNYPSA